MTILIVETVYIERHRRFSMVLFSFDREGDNGEYAPDEGYSRYEARDENRAYLLTKAAKEGKSFRWLMSAMKGKGVGYSNTRMSNDFQMDKAIKAAKSDSAAQRAADYFQNVVKPLQKPKETISKAYKRAEEIKAKSKDTLTEAEKEGYDRIIHFIADGGSPK